MHDRRTGSAARIAAAVSIALGAAILPAIAQQQTTSPAHPEASAPAPGQQNPAYIAVDLNMRRSRLYQQGDTAGVASLYTVDATYIELMPILQVLEGRDQIRGHLQELIDAAEVSIVPEVLSAKRNADGTILVSGDYLVLSREENKTAGHFVQTLRQEDGTWRIASHVFARPNPLTPGEADRYRRD